MIKNFFITAWRNLAKNKVFSLLNVAGLAIGIAVCLVIGIWLQRELSYDRFHPNSAQIFRLSNTFKSESESFSQAPSGPAFGAQLPKHVPSVKSACRLFNDTYKLKYRYKQFIEARALDADSNFFSFFGFKLKNGNPAEALRHHNQIVLTETLAKRYFGDEDPVGKTMLMDGEFPMVVSGVAEDAPVNSQIQFELIVPTAFIKKLNQDRFQFDMDNFWVGGWPMTFVQVADPAKVNETEKQINEIAAKFSEKEWKENKMSYTYFLQPITDIHLRSSLRYDAPGNGSLSRVRIFSIVGIIVLLLACINYVNLTTAGAIKRAKETSVRKVMGATRAQLIRQFFLETFIVCAVAVLIGVLIARLVLPFFSQLIGQSYEFPFSLINILIAIAFIVVVSVIAGIYPSAMLSSFNPATSLKGNFLQSSKGNFIRKSLIVFQFTITIALVASIFVISRQMDFIKSKSLGFDGNAVVEIRFYGDTAVLNRYNFLRNQLLTSPYILNASKHGQNVVGGMGNGWTTTENLQGEEISTSLYQMNVDTSYFNTYSMKLAAGRFFSRDIPTDTTKAVIVNEAAVRTFGWKNPQNAIGKRFGKGDQARYVVGVVKDFNFESLHKPVEALMITQTLQGGRISLKIDARHTDAAINHLEKTWASAIPDMPLQYAFVDESIGQLYGNEKRMQNIFYGFAGLSLLIACLGLFGLSIFIVERKVKEIGIRKVLGASVGGIVELLSRDFLKLVLIAAVIATPLSFYFMHEWLQNFAYRINIGWWIFLISGVIAMVIALVTISFKAIKAAVANPVKSLRTE
jgi:putative ABC transport system permease protein